MMLNPWTCVILQMFYFYSQPETSPKAKDPLRSIAGMRQKEFSG